MDTFEVGPQYFHVVIALGVLATTTVVLRFIARWMSKGQFGADDYWVLVGLVFVYGLMIDSGFCNIVPIPWTTHSLIVLPVFIAGGDGRDFKIVPPDQLAIFYKVSLLLFLSGLGMG